MLRRFSESTNKTSTANYVKTISCRDQARNGSGQTFPSIAEHRDVLGGRGKPSGEKPSQFGEIVPGAFTSVLAKHTKSFNLADTLSVGVDRIQVNFEPMQRQFESRDSFPLKPPDPTALVAGLT